MKLGKFQRKPMTIILLIIFIFAVSILFVNSKNLGIITGKATLSSPNSPLKYLLLNEVVTNSNQKSCSSFVSGKLFNKGDAQINDIIIKCKPSTYPQIYSDPLSLVVTSNVSLIHSDEQIPFSFTIEHRCDETPKFECVASCLNC